MSAPFALSRRTLLRAAAAVPLTAPLAGCGDDDAPAPGGPSGPDRVRVLTGARFQPWEAYLDVADEKGWWAEAGLAVEALPGEGTGRNLALLAGGQTEFATLDPAAALIEYDAGTATEFVLTCQLHANVLASVMAPESTGIRRLRDLAGRRVAALAGGTNTVLFPALGELAGFDHDAVELVPLELPFFPHLASGNVDAALEFVPSRFTVERAVGESLVVLPYAEWLPELPGLAMGVTGQTAAQRPELVRRFNQVALRALKYSVDHPEESAQIFTARREDTDPEAVAAALTDLAPYIRPDQDLEPGQLSELRYAQTIALLTALGAMDDNTRVNDDLDRIVAFDLHA